MRRFSHDFWVAKVNKLRIPLATVPESGLSIDVMAAPEVLNADEASGLLCGPVTVRGTLSNTGEEYVFLGTVSGGIKHACDRCLEKAEFPFSAEAVWPYTHGAPREGLEALSEEADELGDEAGAYRFHGNEIDLAPQVWEAVVLAVPGKFLCDEDCAGLCSRCGANLNRGACGCGEDLEEEHEDNRGLAGLADMFPDLAPKPSEE